MPVRLFSLLLLFVLLGCRQQPVTPVRQAATLPTSGRLEDAPAPDPMFALRMVPAADNPARVQVTVTAADAGALAPFAGMSVSPASWEEILLLAVAPKEKTAAPVPMVG